MRNNIFLLIHILCALQLQAQQNFRTYVVRYKGQDVGTVKLQQTIKGDTIHYKMTSDIKTRFIFNIRVKSVEESLFQNGRLIYSAVNRTVNGDEKVKKQTLAGNKFYTLSDDGKSVVMYNESIGYNLMRMYCLEPVNISKVYSDNYQKFLPITKIKQHTYKVVLPDGNYNYYSYSNGICSKVEVFNTIYNMEMNLKN
ncbi:MAG: hypothetical protein EOO04_27375 [Chitinophagaceae bacterium]|nr:MAG: hypothetical protein EOO04_27375 [Chitinophagaceae bacterium]